MEIDECVKNFDDRRKEYRYLGMLDHYQTGGFSSCEAIAQ